LVEAEIAVFSPEGSETLLQKVFTTCTVKPSFDLGLCSDKHKLAFAGDGAPLETCVNRTGKKEGIHNCSCSRLYTNPTANWRWDSYHTRWFYCHTLYAITAVDSPDDLPLLLHLILVSESLQAKHNMITQVSHFKKLK